MHALAHDGLRAIHLAGDLRIRALIEHARSHGIALCNGELGQQPVEAPGTPERRELLDALQVTVLEHHPLVAEPPTGRALDPGPSHAVQQLVLGDLKQPTGRRPTLGIESRQVGDDRGERLRGQVERQLAGPRTAEEVAGDEWQPPPVERAERAVIALRRRLEQTRVIPVCAPHTIFFAQTLPV